jgi:predicted nucleotidyltransferase
MGAVSGGGADRPVVPASIAEPYRTALEAAAEAWAHTMGERLRSLVLFGSVARGEAHERSDIDLLVVAEGFERSMRSRRAPLLEVWNRLRAERGLPFVEWGLVTKTPEEAVVHSPLYLDIVEEGVVLLDRGQLMRDVFAAMRARMRELGSRRVWLADGSWYWDLKPDFRFGEVVEL